MLVNNAGVMTRPVPITELGVKKWDYTIAVNLRGPFVVTKSVMPIMIEQRSGSIINVSSTVGRGAFANFIAYATSKWGLEGFTQTLGCGHSFFEHTDQLCRTRLCGNQVNRLSGESA